MRIIKILSCSIVQLYLSPDVKQWTKQAAGIACVISYPSTKHNIICLLDIIVNILAFLFLFLIFFYIKRMFLSNQFSPKCCGNAR